MAAKKKKRKALPPVIKIGPIDYKVCWNAHTSEMGSHNATGIITIDENLEPKTELVTVIHEALHAIFNMLAIGERKKEEANVTRLATGITGLLLDNPEFVEYVQDVGRQ